MPYSQLEELTSRKREKVALFLTAENMAGLLVICLPTYVATLGTSIWLRVVILIAAAILGVALTSDINGMAFYERVLWWVRGRARRQLLGSTLRPAEFTATPVVQGERALLLGGPVRRVKHTAPKLGPAIRLTRTLRGAVVSLSTFRDPGATLKAHTNSGIADESVVRDSASMALDDALTARVLNEDVVY